MSLLAKVNIADDATGEVDRLSTGGPLDTDIYMATIDLVYPRLAKSGAVGLNVHLTTEDGRKVRQELWVSSGDEKGNRNFSVDREGNKRALQGYVNANALCLLTIGKELKEVAEENKVVKLYDFEQKKEVPTEVPVLTELLGKQIYVGLEKQIVDKRAKGADGNYHPTGETREVNEIDKFFRASDKKTVPEILDEEAEAGFYDRWLEKNKGKTRNRAQGAADNAGQAGAPSAGGNGGTAPAGGGAKKSLFNQ